MATVTVASSLEKLLLPDVNREDWKKSQRALWWENRKCVAFCFLLYTCSLFAGYEHVVTTSFLNYNSFIAKFGINFHGKKEISAGMQQGLRVWFTSGAFFANCIQWRLSAKWLGRVRLAQCGLLLSIISVVLEIVAPNKHLFMTGRFFMGVADAVVRYGIFLWVTESAIAPLRAASAAFWGIKISIGSLIGIVVSRTFSKTTSAMGYRVPLIIGLGPQIVSILLMFILPESPRWLLMQGRSDDARATLKRLRGGQHRTDEAIDAELQAMSIALELEQASAQRIKESFRGTQGSWLTRFKQTHIYAAFAGTNKLRVLVSATAGTFYVASGSDFAFTGQTYLLRIMGEKDPFKYAVIVGCISLVGSIVHFLFFAEAFGRRPLILSGFFISGCAMMAIGTSFVVPGVATATRRQLLTAFVSIVTLSNFGAIINTAHVIANEVPAQEYRSVSVPVHWLVYFASVTIHDVIQPYWINVTKLNLRGKIAWLYVVTCILMYIFVYFVLPESRGVTLEEMDLLYNSGVSPRKSHEWIAIHREKVMQATPSTPSIVAIAELEKRGNPAEAGHAGFDIVSAAAKDSPEIKQEANTKGA